MLRKNSLRIIRRSLEASLMGLAANSGVSTATIVSIEKYDVYPSKTVRERLAKGLGTTEGAIWPDTIETVKIEGNLVNK